jgi:exodeoxyribonuclease VII small subunit
MADQTIPADIAKMSFEQALEELEGIVATLEQGSAGLEDAITFYERGTHLKTHCEAKLRAAREKVEKINIGPNGEVRAEPANIE